MVIEVPGIQQVFADVTANRRVDDHGQDEILADGECEQDHQRGP
jgi:hypothetical protein